MIQTKNSLHKIERYAQKMLPQNRKSMRAYFQNGCLPEIWYIIDSLNTDTFRYQQEDLRVQFQKLAAYQQEIMQQTDDLLRNNLASVRHRMHGADDVRAVLGTSRCEAVSLFGTPVTCSRIPLTILLRWYSRY